MFEIPYKRNNFRYYIQTDHSLLVYDLRQNIHIYNLEKHIFVHSSKLRFRMFSSSQNVLLGVSEKGNFYILNLLDLPDGNRFVWKNPKPQIKFRPGTDFTGISLTSNHIIVGTNNTVFIYDLQGNLQSSFFHPSIDYVIATSDKNWILLYNSIESTISAYTLAGIQIWKMFCPIALYENFSMDVAPNSNTLVVCTCKEIWSINWKTQTLKYAFLDRSLKISCPIINILSKNEETICCIWDFWNKNINHISYYTIR